MKIINKLIDRIVNRDSNDERKKYSLTDETIKFEGKTLYRIQALKDFSNANSNIKKGQLGGYVESEENLSQEGNCWIFDGSIVCDIARISDNAKVYNSAIVSGNAKIKGNAVVYSAARVSGDALVKDNASIGYQAYVHENPVIDHSVKIIGKNVEIGGHTILSGNFTIYSEDLSEKIVIDGYTVISIPEDSQPYEFKPYNIASAIKVLEKGYKN